MAENGGVLFDTLVHAADKADVVVGLGEGRPQQMDPIGRVQVLVHGVHRLAGTVRRCGVRDHGPSVAFDEHLAFFVFLRADLDALGCDAADVPLAVPEFALASGPDVFGHDAILARVVIAAQELRGFNESAQRPMVQERDHGAFAAAQVQAIVPVRTQAFADSGLTDLFGREVERAFQMFVNRCLALVGERHDLVEESEVAGFFHVLADGRHKPERVVGAHVFDAVDQALAVGRGARWSAT